ncbi:MAG: hypothetical protein NT062_22480 [Proteobacteria bacterium]|nr:hypothetical protein [Pseudomonadota bacterium]
MARLRLAALALAGCASAASQPAPPTRTSGLGVPAGWQALPELATAVGTAARADGVVVEGSEAWGEPARGCYAAWIALRGSDAALGIVDDVLAGITREQITVSEVVRPTGDGLLALAFARAPYRGTLRARLEHGRIVALACFANDREPASCAAACSTLLGGVT